MLASAERYVTDVLLDGKQVPDWKQLDTLADAVTSIEYYLERLADGISENDAILRVAEDSLASLGFPVGQEPTWQQAQEDIQPADVPVLEPEAAISEEPVQEAKTSDQDLVDDEILGIFVEEAEEVLQTIHEHYPRLRQNYDDRDALTEVRRAFHTLKGSGRMVGATSIGELAWSVENLLNRVIDQTLKLNDDTFALNDEVNARIPPLIQEFRRGDYTGDVDDLISRAEALATTRRTETGTAETEATEATETVTEAPAPAAVLEPEAEAELAQPESTGETTEADADDLIDDEILEIFVEEAGEVLDTIREYLPMLLRQHDDRSALTEVRRAFHTLKGSGRMVGAGVIGELAWSVENMLNRVIDGSIFMTEDVASLLQDVTDAVPGLVSDFENRRPAALDTSALEARANALASGEIPHASTMPAADSEPEPLAEPETVGAQETDSDAEAADYDDDEDAVDPILLEIFENETEPHLQTINDYLATAGDKATVSYTDDLSRALHTLKGSANTAGIAPIAAVITPLERFVKESRAQNKRADRDVLELIADAKEFLTRGLAQLRDNPQADLEGTEDYLARLEQVYQRTLQSSDPADELQPDTRAPSQLVQLFLNEGLDIVLDAESILDEWSRHPDQRQSVEILQKELEQLAAGAAEAGLVDVTELAAALNQAYSTVSETQLEPDDTFFGTLRTGHEQLINLMDQVAAGLATESNDDLIDELYALANRADESELEQEFEQQFSGDLDEIDLSLEFDELGQPDEQPEPESPGEGWLSEEPAFETAAATDEDSELDDELAAIFLEEARDLVDSTATSLQTWSEDTGNLDTLHLLQRDLHTLKGGARLAGIAPVGDLSHELETLFEGLTEQRFAVSDSLSDLLFRCHDRLATMVDALAAGNPPEAAPDLLADIQTWIDGARDGGASTEPAADFDDDILAQAEAAFDADADEEVTGSDGQDALAGLSELDPELTGIFLEEAYDLINSTGSALHSWSEDPSNKAVAAELQRDVHTLKGGARMAGVDAIGDLTHVLEDLFEKVAEGQLAASGDMTDLLFACHDRLAQMVEQVATQKPCPPANDLVQQVEAILRGETPAPASAWLEQEPAEGFTEDATAGTAWQPEPEPEAEADLTEAFEAMAGDDLADIFLDEGLEIHEAITECLDQWREDPEELTVLTRLQQELHTLKGGARLSDIDPVADLAEAWSDALEPLLSGGSNQQALLALSDQSAASLKAMLDSLEQGHKPAAASDLINTLRSVHTEPAKDAAHGSAAAEPAAEEADAVDPEVLEIFLEEAGEIMDQLEQVLDDWRKDPNNPQHNQEAQRGLHTLKGGARLSQLSVLGDKAHAFETRLIDLGGNAPDDSQWQEITRDHDAIIELVSDVRRRFAEGAPVVQPAQPEETPAEAELQLPDVTALVPAESATEEPPKPARTPQAPAKARNRAAEAQRAAQETIRVSAPLLDELVNLAGETSITRGRLEQQTSDFGHTLEEMAATIERLREQLRRMDIETEAQILFRAEQEHGPDYGDDFD